MSQADPKPGIILVRSRLIHPAEFTPDDFTAWYEAKHIPDVLATPGVSAAARYQAITPACAGNVPETKDEEGQGQLTMMPYLAVYWLRDLGWLHEDGCEFWRLPLTLPGREDRTVFEVGEFKTEVWELVGRGRGDGDGDRSIQG